MLSTCQRCIRTGVSDLSGQDNGARPSRVSKWSATTIGAFIAESGWRSGSWAPCWTMGTLFGREKVGVQRGGFCWFRRLQGTAALQGQERFTELWSRNPEGVRSRSASIFLRGFFGEELCLPDQSCSCSGSYQAQPIQSLNGGYNREKDSNSQNEETSGGRRLRRAQSSRSR